MMMAPVSVTPRIDCPPGGRTQILGLSLPHERTYDLVETGQA